MILSNTIKNNFQYRLHGFFSAVIKVRREISPLSLDSGMSLMRSSFAFQLLLLLGLLSNPIITPNLTASPTPLLFPTPKRLNVFTREQDGVIHFYVQNLGLASVTTTFDMQLTNLAGNASFPYTTTVSGNETVEAFTLAPIETNAPWNYHYAHSSVIGSAVAVPDESCVYFLPYAAGSSFRVSQGYHGAFSHSGPDEYAIDWKMPVGTPVHAARGGVVVQSRDDMDCGGPDHKFEKCANCVMIQHSDGTIGIYGHLKFRGNKVNVGDRVNAGDVIALSGNTGFSNGPHLHFSVFKARDGKERLSLPVKFRAAASRAILLEVGHSYTAAPVELLPVGPSPALAASEHSTLPTTVPAKLLQ
jgi:murein DD-endopeptidase MepM/ murein hydrolase activator NlpD